MGEAQLLVALGKFFKTTKEPFLGKTPAELFGRIVELNPSLFGPDEKERNRAENPIRITQHFLGSPASADFYAYLEDHIGRCKRTTATSRMGCGLSSNRIYNLGRLPQLIDNPPLVLALMRALCPSDEKMWIPKAKIRVVVDHLLAVPNITRLLVAEIVRSPVPIPLGEKQVWSQVEALACNPLLPWYDNVGDIAHHPVLAPFSPAAPSPAPRSTPSAPPQRRPPDSEIQLTDESFDALPQELGFNIPATPGFSL